VSISPSTEIDKAEKGSGNNIVPDWRIPTATVMMKGKPIIPGTNSFSRANVREMEKTMGNLLLPALIPAWRGMGGTGTRLISSKSPVRRGTGATRRETPTEEPKQYGNQMKKTAAVAKSVGGERGHISVQKKQGNVSERSDSITGRNEAGHKVKEGGGEDEKGDETKEGGNVRDRSHDSDEDESSDISDEVMPKPKTTKSGRKSKPRRPYWL